MSDNIEKIISIEGDSSGLAAALSEAERQVKEASDRFDLIDKQLADRQAERAKLVEQQAALGRDRVVAAAMETRIKSLDKETAALSAALEKQHGLIEKAQARVTATAAKGTQDRINLAKKEQAAQERTTASAATGGIRGAVRAGLRGTGFSMPFIGGGLGGFAGAITGAGAVTLLKNAISDYLDLADAVQKFGVTAGASAEQASTLLGVAKQLGIDGSVLDTVFNSLKTSMQNNPEQFAALGISLKNTDGSARPLIDVFEDVRQKIAGATKDAGTLQVAQELLGGSYRDILPLLGLTTDQLRALEDQVRATGGVMDKDGIEKAKEYRTKLIELQTTAQSAGNTFAREVVPVMTDALDGLGQAFDTLGIFATKVLENLINEGARAAHALDALFHGDWESAGRLGDAFVSGYKDPASLLIQAIDQAQANHNTQVASRAATVKAIVDAGSSGSGDSLGSSSRSALADANRANQQASRDRIQAIQDEARAREDQMREALDAFTKERDVAIRSIEDEQKTRDKAHNAEIDRIQNEQDAYQEAFRVRDQARSDEIDGLREQMRATTELLDVEKSRQDLADAEAALSIEQSVEVFRSKSMSENDYAQAVRNQQTRVKDAEKKVADARVKITQDTAKAEIETRIRAIEAERQADQRLLDDKKRAADVQLAAIRTQMADEKEQSDTRVQQLRDQQAAERDRVAESIKGIEKETAAIVKGLNEQLKAAQNLGAALDYAAAPRTIVITTTNVGSGAGQGGGGTGDTAPGNDAGLATRQDVINAYQQLLGRPPEDEGAITGRVGRSVASVYSEIFNSPEAAAYRFRLNPADHVFTNPDPSRTTGSAAAVRIHDYPHAITLREPTAMVGLRTGTHYGIAAADGDEGVTFGGVGRASAAGGNGDVITINVQGLGLDEAAGVIASRITRQKARLASRTSGRRR